jgi:hypothetical protein
MALAEVLSFPVAGFPLEELPPGEMPCRKGIPVMIVDWIYNTPIWLVGIVIVGGMTLLSCLGLLLFHRFVALSVRRGHNDLVGTTLAVIGTVAAILMAFIGVATWEAYSHAEALTEGEAGALSNLYFDSYGLPGDGMGDPIRTDIKDYLIHVTTQEWPRQQQGRFDEKTRMAGRMILADINSKLVSFIPENAGQTNVHAQMLTVLNELSTARRNRTEAASGHVPQPVWIIMLLGTALTVGYTFIFGAKTLWVHMVVTGSVAASLALVILLIVVMDYPFRGEVSIGANAYDAVVEMIQSAK